MVRGVSTIFVRLASSLHLLVTILPKETIIVNMSFMDHVLLALTSTHRKLLAVNL